MDEDLYLNLLYKDLSGEISGEEANQLKTWLAESQDNRMLAQEVRDTWEASVQLAANPEVDLDEEFGFLTERMEAEGDHSLSGGEGEPAKIPAPEPPSRGWNWRLYSGIAAGLALLAVAGIFLLPMFKGGAEPEWLSVSSGDAPQELSLADGSKVTLNRNSSLSYTKEELPDKRWVKLKGEALFEVKKDTKRPFRVETDSAYINVLGTAFNVKSDKGQKEVLVRVVTGKVELAPRNQEGKLILIGGERGSYATGTLQKTLPDTDYELAWFSGQLSFFDAPIGEVLEAVKQFYQVELKLELPELAKCPFTSTFKNLPFEQALESITTILGSEAELVSEDSYLLKGGTCDRD